MDISQLRFTLTELVSLLGMSQAIFVAVYVIFHAKDFKKAILPLIYFSFLALALFLDAGNRLIGSDFAYYHLIQWFFWFSGPPLSALLIFQIARITKPPSLKHYRVFILMPLALGISYWAGKADPTCTEIQGCHSFEEMLIVSGVVAGALSLLEIWLGRGLLDGMRVQKNGRERYWVVIMLVLMNLSFLGAMLFSVGGVAEMSQIFMIRGVLAISLSYLAGTSLFRIYPFPAKKASFSDADKELTDSELQIAMQVDKLMRFDKVYQETSYSRSDLARELSVSETVLSRIINLYFQKNFPQLINELRVEDAKVILRQTSISIRDVPEEVGFNSLASFNRVFKGVTGETPSEYRQNNTENQ